MLGALLGVAMLKKCTQLWRESHFEVQSFKNWRVRSTFGSWAVEKVHGVVARSKFRSRLAQKITLEHFWKPMLEKCTQLWREAHVEVKMYKTHHSRTLFGVWVCFGVAGTWDSAPRPKWAKRWGLAAIFKKLAGVRCSKRICKDAFCVAGAVQETYSADRFKVRRWFPEKGCILEHQIFRFAKMILRDGCSTSNDLASLFCGGRNTLDTWTGKMAKCTGTRPSALHSTFHFRRKSRRIDVINFENWGSLAEFLLFCCHQLQNEEVSQTCCVFDVVKFENWRSLADWLRFQACRQRDRRTDGRTDRETERRRDGETEREREETER